MLEKNIWNTINELSYIRQNAIKRLSITTEKVQTKIPDDAAEL